jgi:hypothetical protein
MTAFTGERVVAREKGKTKLNYFGRSVSGGLARWRGEVKEAEGELKFCSHASSPSVPAARDQQARLFDSDLTPNLTLSAIQNVI